MNKQFILRVLPFAILCLLTILVWWNILISGYHPYPKHYFTLLLMIINLVTYFYSMRMAVLLTGALILLATFNMLAFVNGNVSGHISLSGMGGEMYLPLIVWWYVPLLLLFVILDLKYVIQAFGGWKNI